MFLKPFLIVSFKFFLEFIYSCINAEKVLSEIYNDKNPFFLKSKKYVFFLIIRFPNLSIFNFLVKQNIK